MMSVNVLLSVSCESMCICRQELLFLALARHFHLVEVQGSEGLGEDLVMVSYMRPLFF
jgi:hypothetical protein